MDYDSWAQKQDWLTYHTNRFIDEWLILQDRGDSITHHLNSDKYICRRFRQCFGMTPTAIANLTFSKPQGYVYLKDSNNEK